MTGERFRQRIASLAETLRARGKAYDRTFAGIEAGLTATGAILLACGGGVLSIERRLGIVLLAVGALATISSLLLAYRRQTGDMAAVAEAVAVGHEAEVMRLEAENARQQAHRERDEQKRQAEIAASEATARIASAEAQTEKRIAAVRSDLQSTLDEKERIARILDRQRRARLRAMRRLVETVEAALLLKDDVVTTAEKMLVSANDQIRQAVGVETSDYFTVSIFRCEPGADGERMCRIGCYSTHHKEREYDAVSWRKGRGYTGTVWNDATANVNAELVIPDTTLAEVRARCPVDDPDPEREARYVSVAAYPIRIRRSQNVWGVVTATINRKNVFARVGENAKPTQGVEMVEDIAYVAALLAGLSFSSAA